MQTNMILTIQVTPAKAKIAFDALNDNTYIRKMIEEQEASNVWNSKNFEDEEDFFFFENEARATITGAGIKTGEYWLSIKY